MQQGRGAPGKARRDEVAPGYGASKRSGAAPGKITRTATPPPHLEPPKKLSTSTTLTAAAAAAAAAAAGAAAAASASQAAAGAARRQGEAAEERRPAEPKRGGSASEEPRGPAAPKRSGEAGEQEREPPPKRQGEAVDSGSAATPAPELRFHELDEAFEKAGISQAALMGHRSVGVREVLGNLNEADAPSLAEELLKSMALAALGAASGYITTAIAEGLKPAAVALTAAIQSGLDDGMKDAATKIVAALGGGKSSSKASFFAGQEDGLVSLQASSLRSLAEQKRISKEAIEAAPNAQREQMLQEVVAAVRDVDAALARRAERGKQLQYQASLSSWLSALAKSELGQDPEGNLDLEGEVDEHADMHYYEEGTEGVVYLGFPRIISPELPLLGAVDMKISGMTEATRQRVADVPLGELGLPVVVRGYVCDGFVDSFVFDDNEVSFGRNEAGAVWVDGDEDGLSALGKAGHFTDPRDTAEQVLRDEVDPMTLAKARL